MAANGTSPNGGGRNLGAISLSVALSGMIASHAALYAGLLPGISPHWLEFLTAGFEAATIGGFADWFAVSALFREVPIPILRRHTNIIVRNRDRIAQSIVDLVRTKWLTPEAIGEKLSDFTASRVLVDYLREAENRREVLALLMDMIRLLNDRLSGMEAFLEQVLRRHLEDLELGRPLGRWMLERLEQGDHQTILDGFAKAILHAFEQPASRQNLTDRITETLTQATADYRARGWIRRMVFGMSEKLGTLDQREFAQDLVRRAGIQLTRIGADPDHPWRQEVVEHLRGFAQKLADGEPQATATVLRFQRDFSQQTQLSDFIGRLLASLKATITRELADPQSPLAHTLDQLIESLIEELESHSPASESFDRWVRESLRVLILKHHHMMVDVVAESLSHTKMTNEALVEQLEAKVGGDLQYIRLNGAVVGGLLGILLHGLKLLLHP